MENILQKDLNPIQEEAVKTINGASSNFHKQGCQRNESTYSRNVRQ